MLTPSIAQIALRFGADDLDGTCRGKNLSRCGSQDREFTPRAELERLIREAAGPVERDICTPSIARKCLHRRPRPDVTLSINV